eukprot:scaffold6856_cov156-Amphora_coffeaeformis.AAC.3
MTLPFLNPVQGAIRKGVRGLANSEPGCALSLGRRRRPTFTLGRQQSGFIPSNSITRLSRQAHRFV